MNDALSAKNDEMEDRIMKLQTKLNQYANKFYVLKFFLTIV